MENLTGTFHTTLPACHGYCGRLPCDADSYFSDCGICPRGHRRTGTSSLCLHCQEPATLYDCLFLVAILLTMFEIYQRQFDKAERRSLGAVYTGTHFYLSCLELTLSAICSILYFLDGNQLVVCRENGVADPPLKDFYTMFRDPLTPEGYINCTTEAVYPLYSIVLVFLVNCLMFLIVFRVPAIIFTHISTRPLLFILKALPATAIFYSIFIGFIYKYFPYAMFIYFYWRSFSKLAIIERRRSQINRYNVELSPYVSKHSSGLDDIINSTSKYKDRRSPFGFIVRSYGAPSMYKSRTLNPRKKKYLYPVLIVHEILGGPARTVLRLGDKIEPHEQLFNANVVYNQKIKVFIQRKTVTPIYDFVPLMLSSQIGMIVSLLAMVERNLIPGLMVGTNEGKEVWIARAAGSVAVAMLTPTLYMLLRKYSNPRISALTSTKPEHIAQKLTEINNKKLRQQMSRSSDDHWWTACRFSVERF